MKTQAKDLFEKMVDFKRFATMLLAVGAFFYLGVIIPNDTKSALHLNMMMIASTSFLAGSIFFFTQAKVCKKKLSEMDEGYNDLLNK